MIMAQIVNAKYIIQIIIAQLFLLVVINAEYRVDANETSYKVLRKPGRVRRAPPFHRTIPPDTLTATITDGDKEIHLTWQRAERYLANKNLPVYTARIDSWGPNHKKLNVMEEIGNFIMYHDLVHKSAIIYFESMEKIQGAVGTDYYIINLPIDRLYQPLEVDGEYVHRMPDPTHRKIKHPEPIPECSENDNVVKQVIEKKQSEVGCDMSLPRTPVPFYIEILLFVTYDIVQFINDKVDGDDIHTIVLYYLLNFNVIDMIYANLPINDIDININLAGIIIEEEDGVFSQITQYNPLMYNNQPNLDIGHIFQHFKWYPDHFDFPFVPDSFDLILISTGRRLKYGWETIGAWHTDPIDIFEKRWMNSRPSPAPMAIVRSTSPYSSCYIMARQIGKILGIRRTDPLHRKLNKMQCNDIMERPAKHCTGCVKWSDGSVKQLKEFLSENRNRCFFLNKPRSLHPLDTPIISHTPCRQCSCFGYHSYGKETVNECPRYIPSDACAEPLQCKYKDAQDQLQWESTILPLDGTPCGENKVCWKEECKSMN